MAEFTTSHTSSFSDSDSMINCLMRVFPQPERTLLVLVLDVRTRWAKTIQYILLPCLHFVNNIKVI